MLQIRQRHVVAANLDEVFSTFRDAYKQLRQLPCAAKILYTNYMYLVSILVDPSPDCTICMPCGHIITNSAATIEAQVNSAAS